MPETRFVRAQNPTCPRELPTCSWKDRTLTDTERCDTCHPPTAPKTLVQQMTAHDARCTRQTNQRDCNHPVGGTADTLFFDPHGNGFCRWEANDKLNAPCGLGKCVFDDACTNFSPAEAYEMEGDEPIRVKTGPTGSSSPSSSGGNAKSKAAAKGKAKASPLNIWKPRN